MENSDFTFRPSEDKTQVTTSGLCPEEPLLLYFFQMKERWISICTGGFVLGIFLRSLVTLPFTYSVLVGCIGIGIAVLAYGSHRTKEVIFAGFFLIAVSLGMLRLDIKEHHQESPVLTRSLGTALEAEGTVVDEPSLRGISQQFTVLLGKGNGETVSEKILVQAERFPAVVYGDRISLRGKLERPQAFTTDAGRVFDYPSYLAKDDIYYRMSFAHVEVISEGNGNPIIGALISLKHAFLKRIQDVIPEPESSLAGGLLLGGKQSLGVELEDEFRTAGIVHIVVLSGYNITIVADAAMRLVSFLPAAFGMGVGALSIFLFALMTGASATIVRASIMALLVVLARATGRTYQITRALFVAGFLMLLQNPKILVFDPSFQLSFLSTIGLIYVSPLLESRLGFVPTGFSIREALLATLATQLTVLPLLLYQTGQLSIVALPVNLLVLPLIPMSMFLGFITGMIGFVSSFLALPVAFLLYLPLVYELAVVHFFSHVPFAAVSVPEISGGALLFVYAVFAIVVIRLSSKNIEKKTAQKGILS